MILNLSDVYDDYPNPFYIIKPIIKDGISEDFEYIYVNQAFCIFIGRNREELVGHCFREYFEKGKASWHKLFVDAAIGRKHVYVKRLSSQIGKRMYTEIFHIEPDLCGCIIHDFKGISDDIKFQESELRHKANCDYLTGFYNRYYLMELSEDISQKEQVGITFLDINNLKITNDTLGHAAGDALILRVSDMIRSCYKNSLVFRIGGDEFVIITTGMPQEEFLKMSDASKKTFENGNIAAIGYNYFEKVDNLKECINQCDASMYKEKNRMKTEHL